MNKVSRNIKLTMSLALLLLGGVAQAQVTVGGKVFGGGNEANVQGSCSVTINQNGAVIAQDVHGGGALAMVNVTETSGPTYSHTANTTTTVTLTKGTVTGNIYGGGLGQLLVEDDPATTDIDESQPAIAADVYGPVTVTVNGGTVTDVFGCNNLYGAPQNTVVVDIEQTQPSMTVTNVYGGGNLAAYTGGPVVNIKNGTVSGSVFGGGYGATAVVIGTPHVTVGDLTQDGYQAIVNTDVYGGGDAANVITGTPVVLIQKCNTEIHRDVYGGGNAADVPATSVTVTGGTISGSVFGGGHGDKDATPTPLQANVADNTSVTINGGTINKVFGGSNSNGTIGGTINVFVEKTGTCAMHIAEVYGGGNYAPSNAGNITVNCTGTFTSWSDYEGIEYLYGGANQADVTGPITLNITKGTIKNVFGGNNTSGTISGDAITVNVTKADDCMHLYNVYGAGNVAAYTGSPAVNINHGTVDNNVYGGGKGAAAVVTGNPVVTIGDNNTDHAAIVSGDVYGGGDAAAVTGATTVTYNDNNASSTVGKLFGGGNAAGVSSAATVTLTLGKVLSGLYGGCNSSGVIGGNITVNVNGGTVGTNATTRADVYGGGYGESTSTTGDVTVTIDGGSAMVYGDVYGGSALGSVNASSSNTTTVNILNGTLVSNEVMEGGFPVYYGGNVFGGGLGVSGNTEKGKVNGKVVVNIGAGTPHPTTPFVELPTGLSGNAIIGGNVYGCNNSGGMPQDDVTVNIFQTNHTTGSSGNGYNGTGYAIANVFGGGNEADYTASGKTAYVNIYTCDNTIGRVFGGGNAAAAPHVETNIQGGRIGKVFGGGNGERGSSYGADISAGIDLTIHGGNVGEFYGGSNQHGTITGTIHTDVVSDSPCELVVDEFFCGGNFVDIDGDLVTTIACSDGHFTSLYGGCKQANITGDVILNLRGGTYTNVFGGSKGRAPGTDTPGDPGKAADIGGNVTLNLYGGTIENVFGGSNINGNIAGTITVNVLDEEGACPLYITNLYGGSNETDYTPTNAAVTSPIVNLVHAKYGISGNVYGGSKGVEGVIPPTTVTANPLVNIGYVSGMTGYVLPTGSLSYTVPDQPRAIVAGSVFGGGDAAQVSGSTVIFLRDRAKVFGNIYGGGNMGVVTGNTKVIVNGENQ